MPEHDFEPTLARRLRAHSEHGLRQYDALEIARSAIASGRSRRDRRARPKGGVPIWVRSLVLAGLLVVLLVAVAVVGGLIQLPAPVVDPSPSPTAAAEVTPTPRLTTGPAPSGEPLPTGEPGPTPTGLPTQLPSPTPPPTVVPSPSLAATPSPSPSAVTSPSPEPSGSPEPTAVPTPATAWQELTDFPAAQGMSVNAIAHGPGGFAAVGSARGGGVAWFSADGRTWRQLNNAVGRAQHLVVRGGQFYALAVNAADEMTRVWRSSDGLNWIALPVSPVLEYVADVTVGNGVMVAVGSNWTFDEAMVWTSENGSDWFSIEAPEAASELTAVAVRGGDIAVIGDAGNVGYGRRLFFRATHSVGWEQIDAFGEDIDGRLVDLATNGSRFVAVGYEDRGEEFAATLRTSVDGSNWGGGIVPGPGRLVFDQIVVLPDNRFLAIGTGSSGGVEVGVTFVGSNGVSWSGGAPIYDRAVAGPGPGEPGGDQVERQRAVAVSSERIVVADWWLPGGPHVFSASMDTYR